jgi:hypothetical protein
MGLLLAVALPIAFVRLAAPVAAGAQDPPPQEGQEEVTRTASGFSVRASNGSLPNILAMIGGEAGFDVLDTGKSYPNVTVAIEDQPLDSILRQLLRDANFIILYKGGGRGQAISGRGIDRIVLLTSGGHGGAAAPGQATGRTSPLAGAQAAKPKTPLSGAAPVAAPTPNLGDNPAAAVAAAAAADAGGSEILRRLRAARAARGAAEDSGMQPNDPAVDSVAAVAAAALAQHNGGQVDPSILEYARQAAQRAIDANANQGGGGGYQNPAPMDDAQFPEE